MLRWECIHYVSTCTNKNKVNLVVRVYVIMMRSTKGCQHFLAIIIIVCPSEVKVDAKDGQYIPWSFVFKVAKHLVSQFLELTSYFQITFIHRAFCYLEWCVGDNWITRQIRSHKNNNRKLEKRMVLEQIRPSCVTPCARHSILRTPCL